jgi:hypothetical protein
MTDTTTPPTAPVSLAARINNEHRAMLAALETAVRRAIACGELLLQARTKEAEPRKWLEWLKANCPDIPERSARRCMTLATGKEKIGKWCLLNSATLADLTLAEAERIADAPDQPAVQGQTPAAAEGKSGKPKANKATKPKPVTVSDTYDAIEEVLVAKLEKLTVEEAEAAAAETIKRLNKTVDIKRTAVKQAA